MENLSKNEIENQLKEYFKKDDNIGLGFWNKYYPYILELLILKLIEQKDVVFNFGKRTPLIKKICQNVAKELIKSEILEEKENKNDKRRKRK